MLAFAIIGHAVVWALACARLSDGARAELAAAGWSLEAAPARWSGWPVAAEIDFRNAVLRSGPEIVPPLVWTVPRLALRLTPLAPTRLIVSADGAETVAIGASPPLGFSAGSLTAVVDVRQRMPPRLHAIALTVDAPAGPVHVDAATIDLPSNAWSAELDGLTMPGPDGRPISPAISRLHLDGRIDPPIEARPTAAESAETWRARSGHLALTLTDLRWGGLSAAGTADLVLDDALQPSVQGQITSTGLTAAVTQTRG